MIPNVLEHIAGIATYPVISFVLFVLVFVGMVIAVLRMKHADVEHLKHLPLEDNAHAAQPGDDRP